jgi:alkanesulfonate monooxygenase SsuD/methylene tetrahydromethanopterin reductase-like flavin-dependent oxidoreductase (luciferase family)
MELGLTLPNRGVLFGATTVDEMLELAETGERSGVFGSVWVGDSIIAKPRLESLTLLAAIAARTRRMKLGAACLASFPSRHPVLLAYQWASLDVISNGRTILVPCMGGGTRGDFAREFQVMGLDPAKRAAMLEEGIRVIRRLWSEEEVTFEGEFWRFEGARLQPQPVQRPLPIWIANNVQLVTKSEVIMERSLRRVARLADGWMTTHVWPRDFAERWQRILQYTREEGRDPRAMRSCVYFNVNLNADRERALDESKRFLDTYYITNNSRETLERWVALGSPEEVVRRLREFAEAGVDTLTIRFPSWDQRGQLRAFLRDVAPALGAAPAPA